MKIVIMADTHENSLRRWRIPDGDVFLHLGDYSTGDLSDVRRFATELEELPHRRKIVIDGNHDYASEGFPLEVRRILAPVCHYLVDQGIEIDGIKFYGTPWQPWYMEMAFNLPRGSDELAAKWDAVPEDTDVLLTHCPPNGILDWVTGATKAVGCEMLRYRYDIGKLRPLLHCFGHVHESRGRMNDYHTLFVNAACVIGDSHRPVDGPVVVELDTDARRIVNDCLVTGSVI